MKVTRKSFVMIILLLVVVFAKQSSIESKKEESVNNIEFLPHAMGIYEKWMIGISPIYSSPTVADLDADGTLEVVIGSFDYKLYCISHNGTKEWDFLTGASINSGPAIADLDADGSFEIFFGSSDYKIYCLNHTGAEEWNYMTGLLFVLLLLLLIWMGMVL